MRKKLSSTNLSWPFYDLMKDAAVLERLSLKLKIEVSIQQLRDAVSDDIAAAVKQLRNDNGRAAVLLRQEYQAERAEIAGHAANIQNALKMKVADYEQEIIEQTKLSMAGVVHDTLTLDLHRLLRMEVKDYLKKNPVSTGLSNREIAVANRISIREVKRRRRCGAL
jgi:hypothetical protein